MKLTFTTISMQTITFKSSLLGFFSTHWAVCSTLVTALLYICVYLGGFSHSIVTSSLTRKPARSLCHNGIKVLAFGPILYSHSVKNRSALVGLLQMILSHFRIQWKWKQSCISCRQNSATKLLSVSSSESVIEHNNKWISVRCEPKAWDNGSLNLVV